MIIFTLAILLLFLVLVILYIHSMQRLLDAISPANRKIAPAKAWLMLIPVFHMVWQFILVNKIC